MSAASLLNVSQETDKKGKTYYQYELLTRTGESHADSRTSCKHGAVGSGLVQCHSVSCDAVMAWDKEVADGMLQTACNFHSHDTSEGCMLQYTLRCTQALDFLYLMNVVTQTRCLEAMMPVPLRLKRPLTQAGSNHQEQVHTGLL